MSRVVTLKFMKVLLPKGVFCRVLSAGISLLRLQQRFRKRAVASTGSLYISFFFSWRDSPLVGLDLLLIHEDFCGFLITHNNTPQSVWLLWMSDQPVAGTSAWQHTTITTDKRLCLWRDSNPQPQTASGHWDWLFPQYINTYWLLRDRHCVVWGILSRSIY